MTEDQQISAAQRVAAYMADEAVTGAFARLEAKYMEEWKSGETTEARESAWGKSRALDDLRNEMRAVVDSGTRSAVEKARREKTSTRRA